MAVGPSVASSIRACQSSGLLGSCAQPGPVGLHRTVRACQIGNAEIELQAPQQDNETRVVETLDPASWLLAALHPLSTDATTSNFRPVARSANLRTLDHK